MMGKVVMIVASLCGVFSTMFMAVSMIQRPNVDLSALSANLMRGEQAVPLQQKQPLQIRRCSAASLTVVPGGKRDYSKHLTKQRSRMNYAQNFEAIGGWMHSISGTMVTIIGDAQRNMSVTGDIGEIGVHEGKFFGALAMQACPGDKLWAGDLFEQQEMNVDQSGRGNKDKFLKNMKKFLGLEAKQISTYTGSSLDLADDYFAHRKLRFRIFSVDGGHTAGITESDLHLASCALAKGGVVILDDFYNYEWLGVAEGLHRFLVTTDTDLKPFLFVGNKVYLTDRAFHAKYLKAIKQHPFIGECLNIMKERTVIAGYDVMIVPYSEKRPVWCKKESELLQRTVNHSGSLKVVRQPPAQR